LCVRRARRIPIKFLFCDAARRLERLCREHDNPRHGRSTRTLAFHEKAGSHASTHRQRPVERTTAMDIAMLALALGFFAAALAYVSACNAL
jgi:hypothetical protein